MPSTITSLEVLRRCVRLLIFLINNSFVLLFSVEFFREENFKMKSGKKKSVKLHSALKRQFNRIHNIPSDLLIDRDSANKKNDLDNIDQL